MLAQFLFFATIPAAINTLECFTCGVFLSAAEPLCRGVIRNNSCSPQNLGCLSIIGNKPDGTFYVEKRCAEKSDDPSEGCKEVSIRGITANRCLCKSDYCNSAITLHTNQIISVFIAFHVAFTN